MVEQKEMRLVEMERDLDLIQSEIKKAGEEIEEQDGLVLDLNQEQGNLQDQLQKLNSEYFQI